MRDAEAASFEQDIVLAGFGGQGVLIAGRLLASAAMLAGLNVLVHNYYEGFVRGGVSECTIVLGSDEIGSPVRDRPQIAAVLDGRAASSWSRKVRTGGLLVRNSSLIDIADGRDDLTIFDVPATQLATEIGNAMCTSLVVAGALAPLIGAYSLDDCLAVLPDVVPSHRAALLALNAMALRRGAEFAERYAIGGWASERQSVRSLEGLCDGAL